MSNIISKLKPVDPSMFLGVKLIITMYEEMLRRKFRPCVLNVKIYSESLQRSSKDGLEMKDQISDWMRYAIFSFGRKCREDDQIRMDELAAQFVNDNRELFAELEILHGGVRRECGL